MTLHLISLPHTQTVKEAYAQCAFTQKVVRFPKMMRPFGYKTIVYASEDDDSGCDELVTCITKEQQEYFLRDYDWYKEGAYYKIPFDHTLSIWRLFTDNVVKQLRSRVTTGDLILISSPLFYGAIHRAFPEVKVIEYGIGYPSIQSSYRVFESQAIRNIVYGSHGTPEYQFSHDAVIPNYFDPDDFLFDGHKEDYYLFMARPIPLKGLSWIQVLGSKGFKIKVAGSQEVRGIGIEWVGHVSGVEKAKLISKARGILSPTLYLEPFGGVVAEAAFCGTPAIGTAWGVYPETIEDGKTGFLVNSYQEMESSLPRLDFLDYTYIRDRAKSLWSLEVVGKKYDRYFKRLMIQ